MYEGWRSMVEAAPLVAGPSAAGQSSRLLERVVASTLPMAVVHDPEKRVGGINGACPGFVRVAVD